MIPSFFNSLGSLAADHVSLLMMLVKATIILIAALGITLSMQRASAGSRHLVWLVTLGMLLLVPALSTWAPLPIRILPAASTTSDVVTAPAVGAPSAEQTAILRSADGNTIGASTTPNTPAPQPASPSVLDRIKGMSSVTLLLSIWAAVVAGIVFMLTWASFSVHRIVRRARPLESQDWLTPLFEIADRLGLEESPRLLQSADAKMPFACGVLKPTIVLPAESESWSLDRRRAVLLHELAHVRRRDLLGHTLGRLVCAVYWFHPLVWTAAKNLRSESERACDDLALACGTRATDYAEHLLDIVTSVRGDATPLVALAMARRKEFEGRMLAILDPDLRHSTPSRKQSVALIAVLALISLTVGAASPVARRADAAVVATRKVEHATPAPTPMPAPVAELRDAPVAAPLQGKQYPDSGEPGVMSKSELKHISTSVSKSVSRSISQSTSNSVANSVARSIHLEATSSSRAIQAIAEATANIGLNAAANALSDYAVKGSKGEKGAKNPDDRPILLAKVLRTDSSASLRRIAAWGLQEYADSPIAVEALANAVRHDADAKVREMAAWALGNGGDRAGAAIDALTAALKSDANERVRVTAAWALGNTGDRSTVDALSAALSDANADVRVRAAWALGNVDPRSAPKELVAMLRDPEPRVRELTAWALYNIQDPTSAPALEAALKVEQNKELQLSYIRALASMGEKSVDAIRGLLESSDQRIKAMAVRALAGGHAAGPWPMPWPEPRPFP
jgi:beta-lactamase regulating signal transducer with metallopeptidase domain/HEAT repeat protein